MDEQWRTVVRVALRGGTDPEDHHVLLAELGELETYQRLVIEAARALFLADHPNRQRVLKGFEATLQLGFRTVEEGSAVIPVDVREIAVPLFGNLPVENYVDRAVATTTRVYRRAAVGDRSLEGLSPAVLELMEQFGATLPDNRWLEVIPTMAQEPRAVVNEIVRAAVGSLIPGRLEDEFETEGLVTRADVLTRRFRINVGRRGIEAPFSPEDKDRVIDALRDSDERRVRVRGRALLERGGSPVRFVSVESIEFADERTRDLPGAWAQLIGLANAKAMPGLPSDLASSVDEYLYGERRDQ